MNCSSFSNLEANDFVNVIAIIHTILFCLLRNFIQKNSNPINCEYQVPPSFTNIVLLFATTIFLVIDYITLQLLTCLDRFLQNFIGKKCRMTKFFIFIFFYYYFFILFIYLFFFLFRMEPFFWWILFLKIHFFKILSTFFRYRQRLT